MTTAGSRLTKLLLALAVLGLLVGDGAVVLARRGDTRPANSDPPTAAADVPSAERRALEAALPELIAFVEETRELRFKERPKVELLSSDDFDDLLRGDLDEDGEREDGFDDESFVGVLRALGLIDGDVDLEAVFEEQLPHILGFYDTETKVLYARGVSPTPYVKQVLVHELTHALDDQHFDLFRPDLDDEASPAFDALVEGSAGYVEARWYDSRPAEQQAAIDEEEAGEFEDAPPNEEGAFGVFEEFAAFPYIVGPRFVAALVEQGGMARLNQAFVTSPTNTEQVIHPERFLAGEGERAVTPPRADGPVVQEGRLGELGLIQMLDTAMSRNQALQAAAGWGNDGYVAWTDGARTCVRATIVMDTTRDTTELVNALRVWARAHGGATVQGTSPVTINRCA